MADFREAIAVVQVRPTNDLISSSPVGLRMSTEEPAQRWADRKPLPSRKLFQSTLVSESRRQTFDESLTAEEDLSPDLVPGGTVALALGDKGPILPLSGRTLLAKLRQQ